MRVNQRLTTKNSIGFTNARVVKIEGVDSIIVCTDCFNIMSLTKGEVELLYEEVEDWHTVSIADFIQDIEDNIESLKDLIRDGTIEVVEGDINPKCYLEE